jgi:hypothetical protein
VGRQRQEGAKGLGAFFPEKHKVSLEHSPPTSLPSQGSPGCLGFWASFQS